MNNSEHKILLVDDDVHIRMLFKRVLMQAGFTLAGEAENGEEAVKLHSSLVPDLTLLDVSMPKLNGIEALKHIRKANPNAMVVMLTATSDQTLLAEAMNAGAQGCIRKDTPLNEIREAVERALKPHT